MFIRKANNITRRYSSYATKLSINTLKILSLETILNANSGHPGIVLSAAPILYSLFRNHLNINPNDPNYFNRDRFVMSAGHGSALLYSILLACGTNLFTIDDLKKFRQFNSKTPGHPEPTSIPGIEVATGPLGQGFAMGVGMAIAEAHLAAHLNNVNKLIDHYTYVFVGDGCLQEGIVYESAAIAGNLSLNKLIVLYDSNDIQLDGKVSQASSTNIKQMFKSLNWNYIKVKKGDDIYAISSAIAAAKKSNKPTLIECKTIIGKDTSLENSHKCHGTPFDIKEIRNLRKKLKYNEKPFFINEAVYRDFKKMIDRVHKNQTLFNINLQNLEKNDINLYLEMINVMNNDFKFDVEWFNVIKTKKQESTRQIISEIIQPIIKNNESFLVGSADVSSSTKVLYTNDDLINKKDYFSHNIPYGVREFAMTAINNGITAHGGLKSMCSTFLAFSDYAKSAIRLSAISKIPALNIYTHDSITVGEDGPTHQPIEQLWSLRMIPNSYTFRPSNKVETIAAFNYWIKSKDKPINIIGSRSPFLQYDCLYDDAIRGAYVIHQCEKHKITLYATGSEVPLAIDVAKKLKRKGYPTRVVSIPCLELFLEQDSKYINSILDKSKKISIEYGSTICWNKYVDYAIGIDQFGASGRANDIIKHFKLDASGILDKIMKWIKK